MRGKFALLLILLTLFRVLPGRGSIFFWWKFSLLLTTRLATVLLPLRPLPERFTLAHSLIDGIMKMSRKSVDTFETEFLGKISTVRRSFAQ